MTLTTQAKIRQEALRRSQGFVEDATAVTTTTITSSAMIGAGGAGDDNSLVGWGLYEPTDALADRFGIITDWDDSLGKATIPTIGARGGTETHEYYPKNDPHPRVWDTVMDEVLSTTHRVVEAVLPTVDGNREHTLNNMPWIERREDILDVYRRISPNILEGSNFEHWGVGANPGLQGWILSGTDATVTRIDPGYGRFSARITSTGGNGAVLTQTIPIPIQKLYGLTINVFGRYKSSTADMASIDVTDGTDTTSGTQHDGGGDWDTFSGTHTVNANAAGPLQIKLTLDATNGSADFENVIATVTNDIPDWLKDNGDQHAQVVGLRYTAQMLGTLPVIMTPSLIGAGSQLIVSSLQPYFPLTAESGAGGITDMPIDCAVSGMITKMAQRQIGRPNAARWQELAYGRPGGQPSHATKYNKWVRDLKEVSKRKVTTQMRVGPA